MRKQSFVALILVLAASIAAHSRQDQQKSPSISLEIRGPEREVKVGTEILVEAIVTNKTARAITIGIGDGGPYDTAQGGCLVTVQRNKRGVGLTKNAQKLKEGVSVSSGFLQNLAGGEKLSIATFAVDKIFDLSEPGIYTVQLERTERDTNSIVKSNALKVTVTK
jgi:hypothetical protein